MFAFLEPLSCFKIIAEFEVSHNIAMYYDLILSSERQPYNYSPKTSHEIILPQIVNELFEIIGGT